MKKLTIEEMQQIATERGGKCLSETYVNSKAKLWWQCAEGHTWQATPHDIKSGNWCQKCYDHRRGKARRFGIEEMQQIAAEHGGKCLSETYTNIMTKLLWECAERHQWEAAPNDVKNSGHWCPKCAGKAKLTIEEMQQIAAELGGKCLSETYVNSKTKLWWQCAEGHQWDAVPNDIKQGHWCPKCADKRGGEARRLTIEEMQQIAAEHGGKCLSKSYIDSKTKLLWECVEGHTWETIPGVIKRGFWCPYCSGNVNGTLEEMQLIAEERGGKCLSETYMNNQTKLRWQCAEGHLWEAVPSSIKSGHWCPECSSGLGERICRAFFEQLFENKFPKCYPKWLVNQGRNRMELDGYCKSLKLAFEHQGDYHFLIVPPHTNNEEELRKVQERDRIKRKLCSQHGIVLIEIPEIPGRLIIGKVKALIRSECERYGIPLPLDFDTKRIDFREAYATSGAKKTLKKLQAIATKHGGKCLSNAYISINTKLLWECAKGHQWKATPSSIKSGHWCKKCAGKAKLTIEEIQQIAAEHGGKCLSETYTNIMTKLQWQCAEGHQWDATPSDIKRGRWCKKCADRQSAEAKKLTIEEMQQIAVEHGGKCLSETYTNIMTKLLWECAERHQWEAAPNDVKNSGHWCPKCYNKRRGETLKLSIEEMRQIAAEHGGKCLSETYMNNQTKLRWQCAEAHQWLATPHSIKGGSWCPKCAKSRRIKK